MNYTLSIQQTCFVRSYALLSGLKKEVVPFASDFSENGLADNAKSRGKYSKLETLEIGRDFIEVLRRRLHILTPDISEPHYCYPNLLFSFEPEVVHTMPPA